MCHTGRAPYRVMQVLASGVEAALTYHIVNPLDSLEWAQVVHHYKLKRNTLTLLAQTVPAIPPSFTSLPALEASLVLWFLQVRDQPKAGGLDN